VPFRGIGRAHMEEDFFDGRGPMSNASFLDYCMNVSRGGLVPARFCHLTG
jgi:hypothetical protein